MIGGPLDLALVVLGLVAILGGLAGTGADSWLACIVGGCLIGHVLGTNA